MKNKKLKRKRKKNCVFHCRRRRRLAWFVLLTISDPFTSLSSRVIHPPSRSLTPSHCSPPSPFNPFLLFVFQIHFYLPGKRWREKVEEGENETNLFLSVFGVSFQSNLKPFLSSLPACMKPWFDFKVSFPSLRFLLFLPLWICSWFSFELLQQHCLSYHSPFIHLSLFATFAFVSCWIHVPTVPKLSFSL